MPTAQPRNSFLRSAYNIATTPFVKRMANIGSRKLLESLSKKRKAAASMHAYGASIAKRRKKTKVTQRSGGDAEHTATIRKRGKVKVRGRKNVTVSKAFKAKVSKALEVKKVKGSFKTINPAGISLALGGQQIRSDVFPMASGKLFSAEQIVHAASRLWNGKAANTAPGIADAGNISPLDVVIDVLSQKWTVNMKNNSNRQIEVKMFKCQPRANLNVNNPAGLWNSGFLKMASNGNLIGTPTPSITTLGVEPNLSPEFRASYKLETDIIRFEPGQIRQLVINGPRMVYDLSTFYEDGTYQAYQKQDIMIMICITLDLVNDAAGANVARAGCPITDGLFCMEWIQEVVLAMPETIGWVSTGSAPAAGNVLNANREHRYVIDQYEITNMGSFQRTDVDQPMTQNL